MGDVRANSDSRKLFRVFRFACVGIGATAIHLSLAVVLTGLAGINPYVSNLLAFSVAFFFSFLGHYYWSFQSSLRRSVALTRFLVTTLTGFMSSNIILMGLLQTNVFSKPVSSAIAVMFIPAITYLLGRHWAFR